MKKVSKNIWQERMKNLQDRRSIGEIKNQFSHVDDYAKHISKGYSGKRVLDVGCGSMTIKKYMKPQQVYVGIDAFPMTQEVVKMEIEECIFSDNSFDTVYAFAMLDNVHDFEKAIYNIKRIATTNVMFLTGINIPPDKYHTIEITEEMLTNEMQPFKVTYRELLHPKILLIEYRK